MIKKKYRSGKTGSADALGRGASRGMPETTPLIKAALNLRVGAGFDVYNREREAAFECLAMNEEDTTDEIQPLD